MKVLVTLGTQKQQFTRLIKLVEDSDVLKNDEIIIQSGHTRYESKRMKLFDFFSEENLNNQIKAADLVITHGGVGSILSALREGKKVLAVPRLAKYKEHVDDHQLEICRALQDEGYILYLDDEENFDEKIMALLSKKQKLYISDNSYLDILRKEI